MRKILLLVTAALIALQLAARPAFALDAPHNTNDVSWSITCTRCHYSPTSTPPWATLPTTTDNTFKNNLCKDCHSASGMPLADPLYTNVKTHSAEATSSSYWNGNWTVECVVCHSPHYQQQSTNAAYSAEAGVNVVLGTTTSLSTFVGALTSTLFDTAASLPSNSYVGYLLIPNTAYPTRAYRVRGNTATSITVDGAINLNYAGIGKPYAIRYGKMINATVSTPNGGPKTVKFFNTTGPNSFGSGVNAVCQVCHTQTSSFRDDGTQEGGNHPPGVADTQPCTDCHSHATGFSKGGCTKCHGNPPTGPTTLVTRDKNDAPVTSDSPGAGAHLKHTASARLTCVNCHTGGMLAGATQGDSRINIGFRLGVTNLGGNYDGKSGRSVYPYLGSAPTTVSAGNTLQCTNLYCHSTGQSLNGASATPVYAVPAWTTPGTGTCGTCHGRTATTLTTGGHTVHLNASGVNGCGDCHTGADNTASSYDSTNHVNRSIDVDSALTYTGGGTPGNGYATCSTAFCHQTGAAVNAYVQTPTWGYNAPNCTVCHANVPATGAHQLHVTSGSYDCSVCHTGAVKDTSYASTEHLDLNIDVAVGGYPANKAIGSAKQSCTNTCHGSRSPVWDDLSGTEGNCSLCHGMAASTTDARDTNGDTSYSDPQVGAHYAHLNAMSLYSAPVSCSDCHIVPAGATYMNKVQAAGHIDGDNQAEVIFSGLATTNGASPSYVFGVGTCSNVYCHGAKMINLSTNGSNTRPRWSQTDYLNSTPSKTGDCGTCHGAPPNTASHSGSETLSQCTTCHDHVNAFGSFSNRALHMDGLVQASGCTGCHGQPPVDAGTMVLTTRTGRTTLFASSNGGAGAHNLHVNSKSFGCNRCHNTGGDGSHQTRVQITFGFTYGMNGGLYQAPTFSNGYTLRSDGITTVQITGSVRQCSNIYCHSSGQAANGQAGYPVFAAANWDVPSSGACGACHKTTTGTVLGRIDTGSHAKHLDASATCGDCHTGAGTGVAGSPDYTDNAGHLNQLIDVASGLSYTGSGAPGNGYATCTTASCHDNGRGVSVPSPQWGTAAAACTACHALQPTTGSHTKHLTGTTYHKPVCGDCHDGAVQGATAPVTHLSGSVEVYGAAPGDLGYPTVAKHNDANYQSCTSAYCHSSGQSLSSGASATPVYSSVTWSTTVTCGGCHAASKASVSAANSGSHALHVNNAAVSGCDACHTGPNAAGTTYSTNTASHVDGLINVASSVSYTMGGAPGNGYGRCASLMCHGTQSPVWGANTTNATCTKCHGVPSTVAAYAANPELAAPGYNGTGVDTAGQTGTVTSNVSNDPQVGAHDAHLRALSSYVTGTAISCSNCHLVPATASSAGHIDTLLPAEIAFSGLATTNSITNAAYNTSTRTCSNIYCHGGRMPNGSANGVDTSPTWTQQTYLTSTPSTTGDCNRCHGAPPTGYAGSSHSGSETLSQCNGCHPHVNTNGTFNNAALHIDGIVEAAGGCMGCHKSVKGSRRQIVEATAGDGAGDFVKASRHVNDGSATQIVTDFDCIVCHAEGDTGSGGASVKTIASLHPSSSSSVKLRNVDNVAAAGSAGTVNVNYWQWPGTASATAADRTNMDMFCLNCHDANGASGINVNGTTGLNLGSARALTPFNTNDNLRNNRDRLTTRTRVVDVKSQFYAGTGGAGTGYNGNPSQHGLVPIASFNTGTRYSTQNATWAQAWNTTHTLRSGTAINNATNGREKATLHCSDCHLVEANAHGATNAWHLLLSGTANDWTTDAVMGGQAPGVTASIVCYKCHTQTVYDTNGAMSGAKQAAGSRINHMDIDTNTHQNYGSSATNPAGAGAQLGPFCLLCHAGDGPGRIHGRGSSTDGDNTTYSPGGSSANGTYTKYRFLPGAWQMWQPGAGGTDTDFTTTGSGNCYFQAAGETVSSCGHHSAGGSATGQTTNYGRAVKY